MHIKYICLGIVFFRDTRSAPSGVVVSNKRTTSVRVSWQAVEDADRYTVTLSKTIGRDEQRGPCYYGSHTVSVVTSGLSVVVGQTAENMLRLFTTYSVIVVAENNVSGSSEPSEPVRFTTMRTSKFDIFHSFSSSLPNKDASVAPRNVRAIIVNSTVISVQWDGLIPCKHVNGRIKWYRVQYTSESSGVVQSKDERGGWEDIGMETLLTKLTPYTNYTIRVAAVDVQGYVGLYSPPIVLLTTDLGILYISQLHNYCCGTPMYADINFNPTSFRYSKRYCCE